MTVYLDFRTQGVAGDLRTEPQIVERDGLVADSRSRLLESAVLARRVAGREAVFVTHGFNVSRSDGVHTLARLERDLHLPSSFVFIGVLWPGDYWIPVINYPSEAADAVRCGARLAEFADAVLDQAEQISFVSHSLGARLVLEAAKRVRAPVREVCLLAAAVDADCLATRQYRDVAAKAQRVNVLASHKDWVLWLAYPIGDFVSDLAYDDDSAWRRALGYHWPLPTRVEHVQGLQIPDAAGFGHGDYFPPAKLDDLDMAKPAKAETFIRDSLLGRRHVWT